MTLIVWPNQSDGGIVVTVPCLECGLSLEEIARKDVPAGVPYVFVEEEELPPLEMREAWDCDFTEPDGYGIGAEAWWQEKQREQDAARPDEGEPDPPPEGEG
jgi:hypothetical protein